MGTPNCRRAACEAGRLNFLPSRLVGYACDGSNGQQIGL